ncbi:MAG: hypothetical protein KKA73_04895 [Chloroflexi bacterium]|nr:hypothetical protein [Chloroflexota bacterium]MBU1747004.1 hypothetical protein [Chloroflexota bacterium]
MTDPAFNPLTDPGIPITFDGIDPGVDAERPACPHIRIWKDHTNRKAGTAGVVQHGQSGWLLERAPAVYPDGSRNETIEGDACRVAFRKKPIGKEQGRIREGWVTFYFIQELKSPWARKQARRRKKVAK